MIRIHLPSVEAEHLETVFRSTQDRKLRDRLQIVLMAHRGRPRQDIAQDLGVHRRTVTRWLNAYCEGGWQALPPRQAKGATGQIPPTAADDIRRWVIDGPTAHGLDRANWTHQELADHLYKSTGVRTSRRAMQRFCAKIDIRLYRPTYRYLRGDPDKQEQAQQEMAALQVQAEAGKLVLLSQDEARFPMVPTLSATLGVKGHRPQVGTRDGKDLLYVFAVVNLISGALHSNTLESPARAKQKTGQSKTRRLQEAFADHLRHVGRMYPQEQDPEVVLLIDNAPWPAGAVVRQALLDNPHLKLKRLPSYSPKLNPIERLWKQLRRRATHNRLFDSLSDLKASLRASLCYFQTLRQKVKSLLQRRKGK